MKLKLEREEANALLRCFQHPHFTNVRNYITVVEVDPKWVAEILPPPLEPAAPTVSIAISAGDQFTGLVMGVNARYGDIVGDFGLAYMMDTDLAVIFGREGLGEPKKLGVTTASLEDGKFVGTVSRFGAELLRIEANVVGPAKGPIIGTAMENFHYKYSIEADGSGITDAKLVRSHFDVKAAGETIMEPTKVEFNDSPFDVYGQIPVVKPVACFYADLDMVGSAEYLATVPGDEFLPWAFFKHDDYRPTMDVE